MEFRNGRGEAERSTLASLALLRSSWKAKWQQAARRRARTRDRGQSRRMERRIKAWGVFPLFLSVFFPVINPVWFTEWLPAGQRRSTTQRACEQKWTKNGSRTQQGHFLPQHIYQKPSKACEQPGKGGINDHKTARLVTPATERLLLGKHHAEG